MKTLYTPIDIPKVLTFSFLFRANGEVVLGGTAYHNNFDTRVDADDTRHILEATSQLVPSLKVSVIFHVCLAQRVHSKANNVCLLFSLKHFSELK